MKYFKIIIIIYIQILAATLAYAETDEFTTLKNRMVKSGHEIRTYGVSDAMLAIKVNSKDFKSIVSSVKKAKHIDDVIDEVASGLERLSKSYSKIASKRADILKHHRTSILKIENIGKSYERIKYAMNSEAEDYMNNTSIAEDFVANSDDEHAIRKMKFTINIFL